MQEKFKKSLPSFVALFKVLRPFIAVAFFVFICCVIVLLVFNWGFTTAQISYFFHKPTLLTSQEYVQQNIGSTVPAKNTLTVPSLGIIVPVVYVGAATEEVFQPALEHGVVHFPHSALAGQVGNVYIFGHSSDYVWSKGKYKNIFALLPKTEIGAEILLTDEKGNLFTYLVTKKFVVAANDVSVLSQATGGKRILTLQTSYPIGTALKRYIVQAELK